MATFLDSPHPLLKEPTLYLADPPLHLKWGHLEDAFSSCGPIQPGGKGPLFVNSPCKQHAIHFADVFHAEMALATLQGAIVPNLDPPWKMALSHSPDFQSSTPQRRLFSQMVKSDTHPHPLVHGASLQTIFRWFRNAGPLVSVESTVVPGYPSPMVVIEYWEEEHANHARVQKKAIHPELLASPSFNLRTFDPANLYCAALGATCEHKILVDRFSQFGSIREATLKKIGVPEAYGFVSFWSRESAANALATMHGTAIAGNKITVRYYEPTAQNAFLTWFAGNPPPRTQKSQGGNSLLEEIPRLKTGRGRLGSSRPSSGRGGLMQLD
ncbi:hypothetical protein BDW22DRAFT_887667 [Trametopsis cervina]|nr:hypothetical protein BDW22DRAFT_887667 [Trametopsis cervina]